MIFMPIPHSHLTNWGHFTKCLRWSADPRTFLQIRADSSNNWSSAPWICAFHELLSRIHASTNQTCPTAGNRHGYLDHLDASQPHFAHYEPSICGACQSAPSAPAWFSTALLISCVSMLHRPVAGTACVANNSKQWYFFWEHCWMTAAWHVLDHAHVWVTAIHQLICDNVSVWC